jgi:hypothetical protein
MTDMETNVIAGFLKKAIVPDLTEEQQTGLQSVMKIIEEYWRDKDTFVKSLYNRLTLIFGKKFTYNKLVSVLLYFKESEGLIKPQEAYELFHSCGLTQQNAPYKEEKVLASLNAFKKLLIDHTEFGLEANIAVFKLKIA